MANIKSWQIFGTAEIKVLQRVAIWLTIIDNSQKMRSFIRLTSLYYLWLRPSALSSFCTTHKCRHVNAVLSAKSQRCWWTDNKPWESEQQHQLQRSSTNHKQDISILDDKNEQKQRLRWWNRRSSCGQKSNYHVNQSSGIVVAPHAEYLETIGCGLRLCDAWYKYVPQRNKNRPSK